MSFSTVMMLAAIIIFLIIPSLKSRELPLKRLIILPAVFLYFLQNTLTENFHLAWNDYPILITGCLFGIGTGIMIRYSTPMQIDKQAQTIRLPGTYLNVVVFILIFALHYFMGYTHAVHPEFFNHSSMSLQVLLFLLAYTATILPGGNLVLFYRYTTAREQTC